MDPKTEKIEARKEDIENFLDEWAFVKGSPSRNQKRSQILKWLTNFKPSEVEDAFLILAKIQFKEDHLIRDSIAKLAKEIKRLFKDSLSRVKFFPLGESPSSSGGMYLYGLRTELGLSEDNFPYTEFKDNLTDTQTFVFFDDIIGSGNQATKFSNKHLKGLSIKAYYVSVFAFEDGLNKVKDTSLFEKVFFGLTLSDEERAFHERSYVFTDEETRSRLRKMCEKYGKKLYPKHP